MCFIILIFIQLTFKYDNFSYWVNLIIAIKFLLLFEMKCRNNKGKGK